MLYRITKTSPKGHTVSLSINKQVYSLTDKKKTISIGENLYKENEKSLLYLAEKLGHIKIKPLSDMEEKAERGKVKKAKEESTTKADDKIVEK